MTPEQRWTRAFRRTLDARGVLQMDVARSIGVSASAVGNWYAGRKMPRLVNAAALSEALGDSRLFTLAREARRRDCEICGRPFLDAGRAKRKRFCSMRCAQHASDARRGRASENQAHLNGRRLAHYVEVVDRYCWDCEPEGMCRTADCLLRVGKLSPLPFIEDGADAQPIRERSSRMKAYTQRRREREHLPIDPPKDDLRAYKAEWMRKKRAAA